MYLKSDFNFIDKMWIHVQNYFYSNLVIVIQRERQYASRFLIVINESSITTITYDFLLHSFKFACMICRVDAGVVCQVDQL